MTALRFCRLPAALVALAAAFAQTPADRNTIRINVNLVQVDAIVTDSHDRVVPNLEAKDFQVLQDGKPQQIANFSYIDLRPAAPAPAPSAAAANLDVAAPPPAIVQPEKARRLFALVVDDLALAFDSTTRVRAALKKFVDSDMQPGDMAAIIRTGAGMGALQQFTADKRMLYAAIDHVHWNSMGRVGVGSFDPGGGSYTPQFTDAMTAGSLAAIQYVVNGLHDLPGRKAVVLFSENMRLLSPGGDYNLALQGARRLDDAANRAGVVIYSIDPRGLQSYALTAADDTSGMSPRRQSRVPQMRATQVFRSQDGLSMLPNDTGGLFFHDSNDIAGQLRKVVADTQGYYLLGYHPDPGTFDSKTGLPKFHKVEVKLTRSGYHVRSRTGFFGKSDNYAVQKPVGREAQLVDALESPFGANQIHVRLTTLFQQSPTAGALVDAMLHIDARDLKFTDESEGWHKAVVDVEAVTFGEDGRPVDSGGNTYTLRYKDDAYRNALQDGIIYTMQQPVKNPGGYQLRVALRDAATEQLGSASEFIEIPDVSRGKLVLSSLVMRPYQPPPGPAKAQAAGATEGRAGGSPAVRVFTPGQDIVYGYQILNPQFDSNRQTKIETSSRVFRDGKEIFNSKPAVIDPSQQTDVKNMVGGGVLKLGGAMKPGDYVLQVVVTDKLGKQTATQWSDFEVKAAGATQ